jgi:ZIP family zinc transporter
MAVAFGLGALTFFGGDWVIDRQGGADRKDIGAEERESGGNITSAPMHPRPPAQAGGSGAAIFIGTLLDNIPESLVLGMGLVLGGSINLAFLVAVFVSNLPEGVAGTMNPGRRATPATTSSGCGRQLC